jgi:hypothetical protein
MDLILERGNYSKQFRKTIFQFREISEDVLKDGRTT